MSKITKATVKAFSRIAADAEKPAIKGAFEDVSGALCVCDGFMMVRLYNGENMPALADVPRVAADPLHARLLAMFDTIQSADYTLTASTARADYHGEKPILAAQDLRAFSSWSLKHHSSDVFPVGGSFVSAARLARMLDILPDARIYTPASPVEPLYMSGADGDGLLLPARVRDSEAARARLDEYKASIAAPGRAVFRHVVHIDA